MGDALREEAVAVGGVATDPRPRGRLLAFGDDGVRLRVELLVRESRRTDVVRVRSTFLRRVVDRLDDLGVAISPPSQRELSGELSVDGAPPDSAG